MKKHFTRTALSMAVLILVLGTSDIATAPGTPPGDAGRDNSNLILYYETLSALSVPAAAAVDNGDNPLLAIQLRLKKLQKAEWRKAPAVEITVPYASNDIKALDGQGGQPATSAALLHTGAAASTGPCDPSFLSMLEEWSKQQGPGGQAAAATSTPNAAEDYETTLQRIQQLQQERVQLASGIKNWAELIWELYEKKKTEEKTKEEAEEQIQEFSQLGEAEEIRRKKEEETLSKRFDKSVEILDLLKKAKSPTGRKEVSIAIEFIQKRDELIEREKRWSWSCFGGAPQEDFKKEFPKLVDELVELWRS